MVSSVRVGDVSPWPADVPFDPHLIKTAMNMRGKMRRTSTKLAKNAGIKRAQLIISEHDEAERRANDPYEQAKLYLGKRGWAVWDRRLVNGPMFDGFQCGKSVLPDKAAVMEYARKLGWKG